MRPNRTTVLGAVLAVVLAAAAVFAVFEAGEMAEARVGERLASDARHRAEIYAQSLEGAIERFGYLPAAVALDDNVRRLLAAPTDAEQVARVNAYLETLNRAAGDLVRAGIALYGVHSDGVSIRRALPLRPVLSLKARVAAVQVLAAGETAGYGRAFTAARETRLAVLTIGYADGLPRCLPARGGRVLLHGAFCPMVGRMCMDQLLVDVTDAPAVAPGDTATLLGQDGGAAIPAEELAARCDTITNELLSRLSPRLGLIAR